MATDTVMPTDWLERRKCGRCNQVDDHPRHGVGVRAGSPDVPVSFHMDCHAQLGCPVCLHQLADAAGVQGAALFTHLRGLDPLTPDLVAELLGQQAATIVED